MALSDSEQAYRARLALDALRSEERLLADESIDVIGPGRRARLGGIRYAIGLLDHDDPAPVEDTP